jgi:hypothetical protein
MLRFIHPSLDATRMRHEYDRPGNFITRAVTQKCFGIYRTLLVITERLRILVKLKRAQLIYKAVPKWHSFVPRNISCAIEFSTLQASELITSHRE